MTVAWYVHHHGMGHRRRFERISSVAPFPVVGLSQVDLADGVRLPSDHRSTPLPPHDDPTARGRFHWAPYDPAVTVPFLRCLLDELERIGPDVVVVDVSVEIMVAARLAGFPVIGVRQLGHRADEAHRLGYDVAESLIAPFPRVVEPPSTADDLVDRTTYVGYLGSTPIAGGPAIDDLPGPDDIVVIAGRGGSQRLRLLIPSLIDHAGTVGRRVHLVGIDDAAADRPWVLARGWVPTVGDLLVRRPTVVGAAGNNVVGDAAFAGAGLVLVPEPRPFREQEVHATALQRLGAVGVVQHPAPDWKGALAAAADGAAVLADLAVPGAERRAADAIRDVAGRRRVESLTRSALH